jgi:ABC-type uncharacterized transport system YnjBCD permease subunit
MDSPVSLYLLGSTTMTAVWKRCAGLTIAPAAWAITTQLGQVLPYGDCARQMSSSLIAAATGVVVALISAAVSYFGQKSEHGRTQLFIDRLSIGMGLAFGFALMLQTIATLLVNACQR